MASQITIAWGDGTTDKIYVSPGSGSNNDTLYITSDANSTSSARTKTVKVSTVSSGTRPLTRNIIVSQPAGGPQIYTLRLIPSTYGRSNTSYVTVTNPDYMYDNTDDTTDHADIRGRNNSSYTYYCYLKGFNFSDVPTDATITNFEVKIKAYRNSYQATGSSSYRPSLCNNTTSISNTTLDEDLTTSSSGAVYTFPKGSLTWTTIKGYGSNFGIRIPLRRTGNTSRPYVYVYGAEIEVTYTLNKVST